VSFALPQHMADNPETPEPFSLKRWSQRKRAAERTAPAQPLLPPAPSAEAPTAAAMTVADSAPAVIPEEFPLPPVDSLTFESDYSAFMQPKIAEETKRAALRKLFSDPSFNVMDGLDIYVGDYTQSDPMPPGMLEKLSAVYAMLEPSEPAPDEQEVAGKLPPATDVAPAALPVGRDVGAAKSPPEHSISTRSAADAGDPEPKSDNP
jgi:Protein of unknown function (DUF3306)